MRLGLLYNAMQVAIFVAYIIIFIEYRPWESVVVPSADFAFFGLVNTSEFYPAQLPNNHYVSCGNLSYSYADDYCKGSSKDSTCDSDETGASCDGLK